jgi:hypothetical protein
MQELLLIIILPRSPNPVQKDPALARIPEKVYNCNYDPHECRRAKGGEDADQDAFAR